jgi:hypothetical protein
MSLGAVTYTPSCAPSEAARLFALLPLPPGEPFEARACAKLLDAAPGLAPVAAALTLADALDGAPGRRHLARVCVCGGPSRGGRMAGGCSCMKPLLTAA